MNKDRLKFRLWNKHKGYVVHGNFVLDRDGILGEWDSIITYEEDEYIIEQCTGLKDKNGNLIYEGDIVGFYVYEQDGNWYGGKGAVVWYNSSWGIETSIGFICFENNIPMANPQGIEIVGNIHEQAKQKD